MLLQVAHAEDAKLVVPGLAQQHENANQIRHAKVDLAPHVLNTVDDLNAQKLPDVELPGWTIDSLDLYRDRAAFLIGGQQVE